MRLVPLLNIGFYTMLVLSPLEAVKSLPAILRRPAPPLSCKSAKLLGRGSLSHSAQNEKEETVRNEIALMLLRIRKNGLFSVKTQSNRYFGWLFNHQTPFPHAAGEARVETKMP